MIQIWCLSRNERCIRYLWIFLIFYSPHQKSLNSCFYLRFFLFCLPSFWSILIGSRSSANRPHLYRDLDDSVYSEKHTRSIIFVSNKGLQVVVNHIVLYIPKTLVDIRIVLVDETSHLFFMFGSRLHRYGIELISCAPFIPQNKLVPLSRLAENLEASHISRHFR